MSDLGNGANVNPRSFDAGVEIGTPGIGTDDIRTTTFVLSHPTVALTLDQFSNENFGVRLTSVGSADRSGSSKLEGLANPQQPAFNPPALIDFEFLRLTYATELIAFYQVTSIDLVTIEQTNNYFTQVGSTTGVNIDRFLDFQFYTQTYEAEILSFYAVQSLSQISFTQTVDFLAANTDFQQVTGNISEFIDLDYYRSTYATELIAFYNVTSIDQVSLSQTFEYAKGAGLELGNNTSQFVDLNFYRQLYASELTTFYNVTSIDLVTFSQTFEYLRGAGLELGNNPSAFIDFNFYRQTYAAELTSFYNVTSIEQVNLFQTYAYAIDPGLQQANNTSGAVDLNFYRQTYATELTSFYNVTSIEQITIEQTYIYLSTVGLQQGFSTSSQVNVDLYRQNYATQITNFYNVTSIQEVTDAQVISYISGANSQSDPVTVLQDNVFILGGKNFGQTINLALELTTVNTDLVNEIGVFAVDDANGGIDLDGDGTIDITPQSPDYIQQALSNESRSEVIFSALPDGQALGFTNPGRIVSEFKSGNLLVFYLIQDSTTDAVIAGETPASEVILGSTFSGTSAVSLQTVQTNQQFTLSWDDLSASGGAGDFNDLVVTAEVVDTPPPTGTQFQGEIQQELIDLTTVQVGQTATLDLVTVNSEAAFNNVVGWYIVQNTEGSIIDPTTGAQLNPGDANYASAAIQQSINIDIIFDRTSTGASFNLDRGGFLLAPYVIDNASPEEFLTQNPNNQEGVGPLAYFSYLEANPDGVDRIRLLGDNTFGFEDLFGGGDRDFNDLVFSADVNIV